MFKSINRFVLITATLLVSNANILPKRNKKPRWDGAIINSLTKSMGI